MVWLDTRFGFDIPTRVVTTSNNKILPAYDTMMRPALLKRPKRCGLVCCLLITATLLIAGCSPKPQTPDTRTGRKHVRTDIQNIAAVQEPVDHPISLYEAMARAIKYNKNHRLEMMYSALATAQGEVESVDLLPELTVAAGYTGQNPVPAIPDTSYAIGRESQDSLISRDKRCRTKDTCLAWSVLDFALSLVQACPQSGSFLPAGEVERKTIQNIIRDIRSAWWQALTAQRLLGSIDPLITRTKQALDASNHLEEQRLTAPQNPQIRRQHLLDMLDTLKNLRTELSQAKPHLAALMGLSTSQPFTLAEPEATLFVPNIAWSMDAVEKLALMLRPELTQGRYQGLISTEQTRVALTELLPDINLNTGWNRVSNAYRLNNSWIHYGSPVSRHLLQTFRTHSPSAIQDAQTEEETARKRRLAMSMAILMQVHLARADYLQAKRHYQIDTMAFLLEADISRQIASACESDHTSQHAHTRDQFNRLLAQVRRNRAYAQLQNSFGMLLSSMGIDPVPDDMDSMDVTSLANALQKNITKWEVEQLSQIERMDVLVTQSRPFENALSSIQALLLDANRLHYRIHVPDQKNDVSLQSAPLDPGTTTTAKHNASHAGPFARVTATCLSFRRQPDTRSALAARTLRKGEVLPLVDQKNGWVQLDLQGIQGWVFGKYVTIIAD